MGALVTASATYVGGFHRGRMNGNGKLTLPSGETYEGGFQDDRKNGGDLYYMCLAFGFIFLIVGVD